MSSMRILVSIITLLLVLGGVRAGDSPAYPDTCGYTDGAMVMCGDQCIGQYAYCYCGFETEKFPPYYGNRYVKFQPYYTDEHCCLEPGESCYTWQGNGLCDQGRKLSLSFACNTTIARQQCYNSYQHSQHIGGRSHYTCPDTCVPWEEMCRGVSWCEGDHQECGPNLRCPHQYYEGQPGYAWYNITKLNFSSSLVPGHHYCIDDTKIDDGQFDSIDRSDETKVRAAQSSVSSRSGHQLVHPM